MTWNTARMWKFAVAALACVLMVPATQAQETRAELKQRFKQRDAELTSLKGEGKVGETWEGFVEAVKEKPPLTEAARKLVHEENADRRKLSELIARERDSGNASPGDVAEHNALRNFASARPNEFLKARVGPWVQRSDVAELKRQGKIGETWQGWVEAVTDEARNDPRVEAVIRVENLARTYGYQKQAQKNKTSPEQQAQRAGRANMDRAAPGEFIKDRDGKWKKKS